MEGRHTLCTIKNRKAFNSYDKRIVQVIGTRAQVQASYLSTGYGDLKMMQDGAFEKEENKRKAREMRR